MKTYLALLSVLITSNIYAQDRHVNRRWDYYNQESFKQKTASKKKNKRSQVRSRTFIKTADDDQFGWQSAKLQTSIGYSQGSMTSSASNSGGTNGLRFDLGSHFDINSSWKASSFIRANYDVIDADSINAPFGMSELDVRAYDLGYAQRFAYQINAADLKVTPFIEAHAGRGYFEINESQELTTGTISAKTQFLYTRLTAAAGIQFKMGNLLPFAKFEYGRMIFDDVVDYEVYEASGNSRSGNSIIENEENLDYTFSNISAGISYLF